MKRVLETAKGIHIDMKVKEDSMVTLTKGEKVGGGDLCGRRGETYICRI